MLGFLVVNFAVLFAILIGIYKTFRKMGYADAWWMVIPILNILFMLKVAERPAWWTILAFIPFVNFIFIYVSYLVAIKVAKAYGKDESYALLLMFFGYVFYPILGFGSSQPVIANS